jgi:hypothetical protein
MIIIDVTLGSHHCLVRLGAAEVVVEEAVAVTAVVGPVEVEAGFL